MANAKKVWGLGLTIGGAVSGALGTLGYIAIYAASPGGSAKAMMRDYGDYTWDIIDGIANYICKPIGFIGVGICLVGVALLVWNYISKKSNQKEQYLNEDKKKIAKFCSNCGKAVNENAAFCDGCGNALSTNVSTPIIK